MPSIDCPVRRSRGWRGRRAAIGTMLGFLCALAAIGDPKAVRPLTEVARFRDLSDLPANHELVRSGLNGLILTDAPIELMNLPPQFAPLLPQAVQGN